jgi:hypothetical protein
MTQTEPCVRVTAAMAAVLMLAACSGLAGNRAIPAGNVPAMTSSFESAQGNGKRPARTLVKSMMISGLPKATAGTKFRKPAEFKLIARGADGKIIDGDYANPITIVDSDKSGATEIRGGVGARRNVFSNSRQKPTLEYSGLAIAPATLRPTAKKARGKIATFVPVVSAIAATLTPQGQYPDELDLIAPSGTGSSGTVRYSQAGWSAAAYSKFFTYSTGSGSGAGCASFTISPASGTATTYTVRVASSAAAGTCILTAFGGAGVQQGIALTYTTSVVGISARRRR